MAFTLKQDLEREARMASYEEYAQLCEQYAVSHRLLDDEPGPGYYLTGYTPFQELKDSTLSKKGYSTFASETERFPEERRIWGFPAPTSYDPGDGLKLQDAHTISRDVRRPSAVFLAAERSSKAIVPQDSGVPDMTRYAVERVKSIGVRPSFNVTSVAGDPAYRSLRSQYQDLQARAALEHKSVSRFIVEADPFYQPPPEPLVEGVLPRPPLSTSSGRNSRETGPRRTIPPSSSPLRRYRDSLREVQTRYGLRLPSPSDYIDEDINGELQRAYRDDSRSQRASGRTGGRSGSRRGLSRSSAPEKAHLYRGRATAVPDLSPASPRRPRESRQPLPAAASDGLPEIPRPRGLRTGPWDGDSDQTLTALQEELEREAFGLSGPSPGNAEPTSALARTATTFPRQESPEEPPRDSRTPSTHSSTHSAAQRQRDQRKQMLSYQERLVLSRLSTGAQLGPGSYTPRDSFTTARLNYGGAPSLARASARRTVIGLAAGDATPGPGSYEASPGLGPKPSFRLNETGKFVL